MILKGASFFEGIHRLFNQLGGHMAWISQKFNNFFSRTSFSILAIIAGMIFLGSTARAGDLTGDSEWIGHYYYANGGSVEVHVSLHVDANGVVTGRTEEPATFGNGSSPKLFANIHDGSLRGDTISFTKTYDGTGGVNHSVNYSGRISGDGKAMSGDWATDITGKFFLVKVSGS
jgi:hypothetical protein